MTKREHKRRWLALLKNQQLFCVLCGELILKSNELTAEHEPPKSRVKELGESILLPSHKKCNNEKGALSIAEYQEWKKLNNLRVGIFNGR